MEWSGTGALRSRSPRRLSPPHPPGRVPRFNPEATPGSLRGHLQSGSMALVVAVREPPRAHRTPERRRIKRARRSVMVSCNLFNENNLRRIYPLAITSVPAQKSAQNRSSAVGIREGPGWLLSIPQSVRRPGGTESQPTAGSPRLPRGCNGGIPCRFPQQESGRAVRGFPNPPNDYSAIPDCAADQSACPGKPRNEAAAPRS